MSASVVYDTRDTSEPRYGPATGVKIVDVLGEAGEALSAAAIASRSGLEESYVRRTCARLATLGLIEGAEERRPGTRPVKVYRYPVRW